MSNPLALRTGPGAARVFFGYRAPNLREAETDDPAARADKRARFFNELGQTFMPGTPLMQAPLGLTAYLPAVIDPPSGSQIPDEAAIIVYASFEIYTSTRETSLSRRMYTRSHAAVFDMPRSPAAFPAGIDSPATAESVAGPLSFWYLFNHPTDWQDGDARFLLLTSNQPDVDLRASLLERARTAADVLKAQGCDQLIGGCAREFAAVWLHSSESAASIDVSRLLPRGAEIFRDLPFSAAWVRGDGEKGVRFDGPAAYNFRFARDLRHFVV